MLWDGILDLISANEYTSERWVTQLSILLTNFVNALIKDRVKEWRITAPLSNGVQGDATITLTRREGDDALRLTGTVEEDMQTQAFVAQLSTFVQGINLVPDDKELEGPYAIFAKLLAHHTTFRTDPLSARGKPWFQPCEPVECPYGMVFCGTHVLLTQFVFDQRPRCIIRHSPILPLSGPNARPGFIALLIGMLLPSSAVPYPAFNTKSPTWQFFCKTVASPPQWMLIEPRYRLDAGSGGGNSGGGGEGGNGGPIDSGGGGGKSSGARDVPRNGGSQKRTHEPSTEGERDPKKPRMEEGKQSDATSDMHGVLTRGSYLILESPGGEVTRCAIWGVDDALEFMRSARPTPDITFSSQSELPTLALTNPLNSRRPGTVWAGVVAGRQVIVKRFQPAEYDELATELGAHQCLVPLWPKIVSCDAVIAPLDCAWMALVMEDRGLSIASRGGFAANPWHKLTNLYRTIEAVHAAGVKHGDLAARNVVVTPSGDLCLIDFGEATLEHLCAGQSCPELVLFQNIMDGEDGEDSEGNNSSS